MPSFDRIIDWVLRAACCLASAIAPASFAQPESEAWFGFGLGMGELFEEGEASDRVHGGAFAGALYASYQAGAHLLGVRSAAATEITGDHVFDVGALYGRATTGGRGHVSFGAGLSVVVVDRNPDGIDVDVCLLFCGVDPDSDDRPDDDEGSAFTVGVPLELQLFVRPRSVSSFGFGVYVFANVNMEAPFVGATASFQVGRFR